VARKARVEDLGRAIAPAANGDGALHQPAPEAEHQRIASSFPPIAEYAFLSDCEVNCLIAPSGDWRWGCWNAVLTADKGTSGIAAIDDGYGTHL